MFVPILSTGRRSENQGQRLRSLSELPAVLDGPQGVSDFAGLLGCLGTPYGKDLLMLGAVGDFVDVADTAVHV